MIWWMSWTVVEHLKWNRNVDMNIGLDIIMEDICIANGLMTQMIIWHIWSLLELLTHLFTIDVYSRIKLSWPIRLLASLTHLRVGSVETSTIQLLLAHLLANCLWHNSYIKYVFYLLYYYIFNILYIWAIIRLTILYDMV